MSDRPRPWGARMRRRLVAAFLATLAVPVRGATPSPHARFVARAFANRDRAVAAGDQPYGAVLACGGDIVADGVSAVVVHGDPTAHAEMEALRAAMRTLGRRDLSGCVLYGTAPACAMCETAAAEANVARLYHGREAHGGVAPRRR